MTSETKSDRDLLLQSCQYIAHPDFNSYARWDSINATSNELKTVDGDPATIAIVGQVVTDKLSVQPLGNFQSRQQRTYQDTDTRMPCSSAKLVVVLKRPVAPAWRADFETALRHFDSLESAAAKNKGQRQWFLDMNQEPHTVRFSFPLWEQKKYKSMKTNTFLEDEIEEEDSLMRELREDHDYRVTLTTKYSSYVPDDYIETFRTTAKSHHIKLAPIFFSNGKCISPDQYAIRLENSLVEIMFGLKHYYYPGVKGKPNINTFTATIQQIRILEVNPVIRSPTREPTMKTLPLTPITQSNKKTIGSKRNDGASDFKDSPTRPKKIKLIEASSSASTLDTVNSTNNSPPSPVLDDHQDSETAQEKEAESAKKVAEDLTVLSDS